MVASGDAPARLCGGGGGELVLDAVPVVVGGGRVWVACALGEEGQVELEVEVAGLNASNGEEDV